MFLIHITIRHGLTILLTTALVSAYVGEWRVEFNVLPARRVFSLNQKFSGNREKGPDDDKSGGRWVYFEGKLQKGVEYYGWCEGFGKTLPVSRVWC